MGLVFCCFLPFVFALCYFFLRLFGSCLNQAEVILGLPSNLGGLTIQRAGWKPPAHKANKLWA